MKKKINRGLLLIFSVTIVSVLSTCAIDGPEEVDIGAENFIPEATYYVAVNGIDAEGKGSLTEPWKTVNYAIKNISAGCQVIVKDGTYDSFGYINGIQFERPVLIKAEHPYKAQVKGTSGHRTMYITKSKNMIFYGFEFAGNKDYTGSVSSSAYLMQIELSDNIILENNILHDSYNNDLLKLNEHSNNCKIRNNIFYNQNSEGGDEHIDANSVYNTIIEGNIFFNDYKASGREEANRSFSFVLFKSSSSSDISTASHDAIIRNNVFLNWWGKSDQSFICLGEDGKPFYEVRNVEISDNLFINNKTRQTPNSDGLQYVNRMSGALTIKNAQDVLIIHNIITGTMQHSWHAYNSTHDGFFGYLLRLSKEWGNSPIIDNVKILGNSLVDYKGYMGYISSGTKDMVKDLIIDSNNYYNGGMDFLNTPVKDLAVQIKYDKHAAFQDPRLESNLDNVTLPYFINGTLHGGYSSINAARIDLIKKYGSAGGS